MRYACHSNLKLLCCMVRHIKDSECCCDMQSHLYSKFLENGRMMCCLVKLCSYGLFLKVLYLYFIIGMAVNCLTVVIRLLPWWCWSHCRQFTPRMFCKQAPPRGKTHTSCSHYDPQLHGWNFECLKAICFKLSNLCRSRNCAFAGKIKVFIRIPSVGVHNVLGCVFIPFSRVIPSW